MVYDDNNANIKTFFLNAYWLKSGWVVLINYVFLTSYSRNIKSFLKSNVSGLCVEWVCYLRKDALNGFDVCIGSAHIKKKVTLVLNAYLQNQRARRLIYWVIFRVCSSCFWWEIACLLVLLKKIRWKFAGKIEFVEFSFVWK